MCQCHCARLVGTEKQLTSESQDDLLGGFRRVLDTFQLVCWLNKLNQAGKPS